jgi:hypothetical protein
MKKIVGLSISAVMIVAISLVAFWAYSGDTQVSANDQVGTLKLKINNGDTDVRILKDLNNVAPGDSGNKYITLQNAGNATGNLDIRFSAVTNTETSAAPAKFANGVGDLGRETEIAPWIDLNNDGTFTPGLDMALKSTGATTCEALQWDTVNNFGGQTWNKGLTTLNGGDQYRFNISWQILTSAGNEIQGDTFSFGVDFTLNQKTGDQMAAVLK